MTCTVLYCIYCYTVVLTWPLCAVEYKTERSGRLSGPFHNLEQDLVMLQYNGRHLCE